ncbi:MAG: universal stress protein [Acidobacteria bacterium]|nr:universal stress protein [Acidobacteriota bacterium]
MNVLMATDGSRDAATALRTAARMLRPGRIHAHLLCVAPELQTPGVKRDQSKKQGSRRQEQYRRQILLETERILKEAEQLLRLEGIQAQTVTEIGSAAEVIVRLADGYDVTVIGAHGRYEATKPGLGPVASRVLEYAPGMVLVGRETVLERSLRILLPMDGSLASEHAQQRMVSCFNIESAEITLMHVVEAPWIRLGLDREWFDYPGGAFDRADPEIQLERELRLEAEEVLEEARKRLEPYGAATRTMIAEGNPGTEILGEAETGEYDLIVLGATGISDVKHAMLGSVSTKVAWHAPCAVAVVKHERGVIQTRWK